MRFLLLIPLITLTFCYAELFAQQKSRVEDVGNAFKQLRQTFQQNEKGTPANPQTIEREKARSVETWVKRNSWRELHVREQAWLVESMTGPDQIDKRSFSIRWTGLLDVPANGRYTFSSFTPTGADGIMKLWLNDQLIIDTSITSSNESNPVPRLSQTTDINNQPKTKMPIGAISLTVGKPANIKIEYTRTPSAKNREEARRVASYPSAILAWQSDVIERQIIPPSAFIPPKDVEKDAKQGLKGEYFADKNFTKRVAVRVDPNIDFIWDIGRIATEYRDSQREIVSATVSKIITPGYLTSLETSEAKEFVQEQLPKLFAVMSASERVSVIKALSEQQELIKLLTFQQMSGILRWYVAHESAENAIDILIKWSKNANTPVAKPGFIPGRSPGGYLTQNVEPYHRLARSFLGNDKEKNIEILSANIANEDGSCNLPIAYVLVCVCRATNNTKILADITDSKLYGEAAKKLSGDTKATWRILEAFKYESAYGNEFQPGIGITPIEKAIEEAESPELRFRITAELVARLIASDRSDEAQSLVMSIRDQFPDETKQNAFDSWLESGNTVKKYYEKLREETTEEQDQFIIEVYSNEIKKRAETAEKQGDKKLLNRYRNSIAEIEKKQDEIRKSKKNQ
jgi:hypothetical protein